MVATRVKCIIPLPNTITENMAVVRDAHITWMCNVLYLLYVMQSWRTRWMSLCCSFFKLLVYKQGLPQCILCISRARELENTCSILSCITTVASLNLCCSFETSVDRKAKTVFPSIGHALGAPAHLQFQLTRKKRGHRTTQTFRNRKITL
jgi:hypothetical protein